MLKFRPRDLMVQAVSRFKRYRTRIAVAAGILAVLGVAAMVLNMPNSPANHSAASSANVNGPAMVHASKNAVATYDVEQTGLQAEAASTTGAASTVPDTAPRKVIEQASVTVVVSHVKDATDLITSDTAGDGGFVQSLQWSSQTNQSQVLMTVRIPADHLASFLSATKALGTVTSFSQTGNDVTDQFNGLQDTMNQLKDESAAYTRLYNKAQSMQDMLVIQDALSKINGQIQELNSNLTDINRQVQLATVNLTLSSTLPGLNKPQPISALQTLYQSIRAVGQSALALLTLIAWLLPWAVVLLVGYWIWRIWTRDRRGVKKGS